MDQNTESMLQLMRGQGAMVSAGGASGTYTTTEEPTPTATKIPWLLILGAGAVLAFLFMRRR